MRTIDMTKSEIDGFLHNHVYASLGCVENDMPYVVPITYVYSRDALYGYTFPGRKINIMKKNNHVCVQVHEIESSHSWKSVVAFGVFEELSADESVTAMRLMLEHLVGKDVYIPFNVPDDARSVEKTVNDVILYKITIQEVTGRRFGKNVV